MEISLEGLLHAAVRKSFKERRGKILGSVSLIEYLRVHSELTETCDPVL
jgi:hypothetical protein